MAGNRSIFVSNFFSVLWSKSILVDWNFQAHQKSNQHFGEIYPGAGMTAFQKYRSNPYRIVHGDTVPNTEALNAARIETGAASATHCSMGSNVNRSKTQA